MKKKFFFDRKEKKLQMDSEENSFERCVLCGVVTDVPVQMPVSERKCYIPGAGQLCRDCCRELYVSECGALFFAGAVKAAARTAGENKVL